MLVASGHSLPGASNLVSMSPKPLREHLSAWWRGNWSYCFRRIPQTDPECLFLFEKILLLNPAAPYKERPVLSHNPPLQLDQGLSGSWPHTAQLSTLPASAHSLHGFTTSSLFPSLRLQATRCFFVLLKPCLARREPLTWLSPRSPTAGLAGIGLGLQLPWSLRWSQGPFLS